jgi:hypothetical protein
MMNLKEVPMPKMNAFDVVRLHVHDDGDIELEKKPSFQGELYPGDLFYDLRDITKGRLDAELQSYGVEPEVAKRSIDEVITSEYGTIIEVK